METSNRPTRMFKVTYEHLATGQQFTVYVESATVYEASESVLNTVGEDTHDLIMAQAFKPNELN